MASMDIFRNDAFRTRELSEAVNIVPNQYGKIGDMGLFIPKPIRSKAFQIECKDGVLTLIVSSPRGTPMPGVKKPKRKMRDFSTRRFGLEDQITSDDIDGIRAFGSETELKQVLAEVNERISELRGNMDITREYLRAGALNGKVMDADGSTIVDLFDAFEVTQKSMDFTFGTVDTDWEKRTRDVSRHIEKNLKGDAKTGVHALCSEVFWDRLMRVEDFREAHKYYSSIAEPLRNDNRAGITWQGVRWEEYSGEADVPNEDGTFTTRRFIADGEAIIFPGGTRTTFREVQSPADYMEAVNTPGKPFYAKTAPDPKWNRYVDVEVQMNLLPMCLRPATLVRAHSSN